MNRVRAALKEAGYNNEKTVLLAPSDPHYRLATSDRRRGCRKDAGMDLEVQSLGCTAIVRRESSNRRTRVESAVRQGSPQKRCCSSSDPGDHRGQLAQRPRSDDPCRTCVECLRPARRRSPRTSSASVGSTCRICRSASGISRWRGRTRRSRWLPAVLRRAPSVAVIACSTPAGGSTRPGCSRGFAPIVMAGEGQPSTSCDARAKEDVDGGAKMLWGWAVAAACILSIVQKPTRSMP